MTSRGHDPTRQNQNPSSRRPSDHSDLVSDQSRGAAHTRPLNSGSNDVTNDWFPKTARYQPLGDPIAGGMGVVFRALDTNLDIEVAIKRIRPEFMAHQELIKRFEREAKTQVRLRHPNLVAVRDFAQDELGPYIVMDWIKGRSLAQALKEEGPFEWQRAATIISKVAAALQVAHDAGIIHRDIKPANILLDEADEPHVTDFGLVRLEARQSVASETMTGALLGTVDFVAPEQLEDPRNASVQSDIWSLGATLYRLVTNRSVRGMRESLIPEELRAFTLRAMEDQLIDRFQSMRVFHESAVAILKTTHLPQSGTGPVISDGKANLAATFRETKQRTVLIHQRAEEQFQKGHFRDAMKILETLPENLRDEQLYQECVRRDARVAELDGLIGEAVCGVRFANLRSLVVELQGLQPDRADIAELLSELDGQRNPAPVEKTIDLLVPAVSEHISEVFVGEVCRKVGQFVKKGDSVVGLETDKATFDVPAPCDAIVKAVLFGPGETAKVGDTIAVLTVLQPESRPDSLPARSVKPEGISIDEWDGSPSSVLQRIRRFFSQ